MVRGLAASVITLSCAVCSYADADTPVVSDKAAFEKLKSLAGTWTGQARHGGPGSPVTVAYATIAGGSAVAERLFVGSKHEMLTVYTLDAGKLVLTHYCAAGNQPHMVLNAAASAPDSFVFEFAGGANLNPEKDMHMHSGRVQVLADGKLRAAWDSYQDGKKTGVAEFDLVRAEEVKK